MIIKNISQNKIILNNTHLAETFFARLKGLLGTRQLEAGKGLIIRPCNSIHTVGMNYAIDVLFINKQDCIVKIESNLAAGKFSVCRDSSYVVELPSGVVAATGTAVGDKLAILDNSKTSETS